MKSVKEAMLLYVVTDRTWLGDKTLAEQVEEALLAGATCLQLREKDLPFADFLAEAKRIKIAAEKYGVPFFINDNVEIALSCGADGVHVGQSDTPAKETRRQIGDGMILGVSAQTVEQAIEAEQSGADYIGVGAVFSTSTKLDADAVSFETLKEICRSVSIPVVAIGGITAGNIGMLAGSGIDGVAVVSAVFSKPDIAGATRELLQLASRVVAGMKYKGAIFDLDGTLIDSMPVWANLGADYLASQGVTPPRDIAENLKPMSLLQAAAYFQQEFKIPLTAEEMIDGFHDLIERQYRECVPLKPHVLSFLGSLREAGVRLCIVTANDRRLAEAALARLGVLHYFDFILTCSEAGSGKDGPAIFLQAQGMLGTAKEETILFDDALHAIASAKTADLTVCGVFDASAAEDARAIRDIADYYIDTFKEWERICK